jgi:crotonobetainyl-CoA:carnitine CoA-transferase CaiB-like acyl-CoA transferase
MIVDVEHLKAGRVKTLGHPVKFSETPARITQAAPVLGQHTKAVLTELGYGTAEIEILIGSEAVIAA